MARDLVRRVRKDIALFAEQLLGQPLWDHQRELVESTARHLLLCAGRQSGKSTAASVLMLHHAFCNANSFTLVVSATEEASRDLLGTVSSFAANPLLAGSVVDDLKGELTLSNGSRIRSIPASQRRARGPAVDLLVVDEAAFVPDDVIEAARFTTIAKPGSRLVLSSTPWGPKDRPFAVMYRAGLAGTDGYASFTWPSGLSPLVDTELVEMWRETMPEKTFLAEIEAQWTDDQGSYFSTGELESAVRDFALIQPHEARGMSAVAGVDWGFVNDASTLVLLAAVGARADELECDPSALYIPFLDEGFNVPYAKWVDRVAQVGAGYRLRKVMSECNGVGAGPTQDLIAKLGSRVEGLHTTSAIKEDGFARAKVLLQQGRLILPRHPALLRQLHSLEFEQSDTGTLKIAVPSHRGHDDVAMALCMAIRADPTVGLLRGQGGPTHTSARKASRRPLPATPTSLVGGDLAAFGVRPGSYAEKVARKRGVRVQRPEEQFPSWWPHR